MELGQVIKDARKRAGLSQDALGAEVGVSGVAVGQWENGRTTPTGANMLRLIDRLDIEPDDVASSDYFFGAMEAAATRYGVRPTRVTAPLYASISAGTPREETTAEGRIGLPEEILAEHPNGFFLRVTGDCMNRVLPNGVYAFIDPDSEVNNGDVAAVLVNEYEATLRRFHRTGNCIVLSPDSYDQRFSDQIFDYSRAGVDEVRAIGRVVWSVAPYGERL